jgi:hypothetical protein
MCKLENKPNKKQSYEVQDIIRKYSDEYMLNNKTTSVQKRAITDILNCRTSSLGYNARQCSLCKHMEFSYNSCRNRNCPKCQGNKRYEWVNARLKTTINVAHYHTVFTVPNQLFEIAIYNQKIFYDLLFKCASDTLKQFAQELKWWDVKHLQYNENNKPKIDLSFFGVLHTWGQTLVYHPHIHFIVASAGIINNKEIVNAKYKAKFLFPVRAMSMVFRGKLIQGIKKAYYKNELYLNTIKSKSEFESFLDYIVNRKWVIYMKSQFPTSNKIIEYLSRYTHRTAISNSRILSIDNNTVRFVYKDYKNNSKLKTMKLHAHEFIKRFLYHIPPKRYFKIRYYGKIQKLKNIIHDKILTKNTQVSKSKCKKCTLGESTTIVVVNFKSQVVQGLMTEKILQIKQKAKFNDSS